MLWDDDGMDGIGGTGIVGPLLSIVDWSPPEIWITHDVETLYETDFELQVDWLMRKIERNHWKGVIIS